MGIGVASVWQSPRRLSDTSAGVRRVPGEGTHGGRVRSYLRIGGRSGPGNMTIEQMVWIGRPAGLLCSAAFGNLPIRGHHRPRLLLLPEAAGDYAGAD